MEKGKQNVKQQWLKKFVDREADFDYEVFCEMMRSPGNDVLKEELDRLCQLSGVIADKNKIWQQIQPRMNKTSRHLIRRCSKYVAILILSLLTGVLWWINERDTESVTLEKAQFVSILPGTSKAYVLFSQGQRMDLTTAGYDTTVIENGVQVRVDSSGKISYVDEALKEIEKKEIVYNTIVVPRAGEYKLELADGTFVWLNSDSELRFPVRFDGNLREVYLKGEGYFDVKKNPDKPFRVIVDDLVVKVLGTSFNINAYGDQGNILTTLISGKVDIQDKSGKSLAVMQPDQQAAFQCGEVMIKHVDAAKYVAWIDGKFYFDDMSLENIMSQLQRWYDIEVFFTDEILKSYPFTGVIRKDFSARQIFDIIEKTTQVKFNVKGRCVTVDHR